MTKMGKFIVFEGNEGTGKSTHIKKLSAYLKTINHDHIVTREPGGTEFGESIRSILLNSKSTLDPTSEALLFYASRIMNYKSVILSAMEAGKTVICDRFHYSTLVYQGLSQNCKEVCSLHNILNKIFSENISIVVYLDASVDTCFSRINKRQKSDKFELQGKDFLENIKKSYEVALKDIDRKFVVDTDQELEVVTRMIREKIELILDE